MVALQQRRPALERARCLVYDGLWFLRAVARLLELCASVLSRYAIYLVRWQLSTPILAVVVGVVAGWPGAVLANLIGGLLFFWADRWIFGR